MYRREVLKRAGVGIGWMGAGGLATGQTTGERIVWEQSFTDLDAFTPPSVVGDTLYVGAQPGTVLALDRFTGDVQWRQTGLTEGIIVNTPTIVDGRVYVVTSKGCTEGSSRDCEVDSPPSAHALDAESGEILWSYTEEDSRVFSDGPTVADGTMYVTRGAEHYHEDDHALIALDAESGQRRWRLDRFVDRLSTPLVDDRTLYLGLSDLVSQDQTYGVLAVDAETRETLWRHDDVYSSIYDPPTMADGTLYVAGRYRVQALDPRTGARFWETKFEMNRENAGGSRDVTVADGTVLAVNNHGLFAADAETGEQQWYVKQEGRPLGAPTVAGGVAFWGTTYGTSADMDRGGRIHAVDLEERELLWTLEREHRSFYSPVVANGTVYATTNVNQVFALDGGVDGSSVDSLVTEATRRQVGGRVGNSSDTCPVVDASTVEFDPFPATVGESVGLDVAIEGATDATVHATYTDENGEEVTVERSLSEVDDSGAPDEATQWSTDEDLPPVESVGAWVDVSIQATNDQCTIVQGTYEDGSLIEGTSLGYYVFETTMDVAVVLGRYPEDQPPSTSELRAIDNWQRARRLDTNRFFGSERGSMGAVGFDFTFDRPDDDLYELPEGRDDYDGGVMPKSARRQFLKDLRSEASIGVGEYDFWIGTHAGAPVKNDESRKGVYFPAGRIYTPTLGAGAEAHEEWLHEIGHAYGLVHTYDRGMDNNLCVMANGSRSGSDIPSPSPMSTVPRLADSLGLDTPWNFASSDDWGDWLTRDATALGDLDGYEREVPAIQQYDHGDPAPVVEKERTGRPNVTFVLESRPFLRGNLYDVENQEEHYRDIEWAREYGGAVVYRRQHPASGKGSVLVPGHHGEEKTWGVFTEPGDFVTDKIGVVNPGEVTFELEAIDGGDTPPDEFSSKISATRGSGDPNTRTVALSTTVSIPPTLDLMGSGDHPPVTPPALDLVAVDAEGRRVGVTEDGRYVNEIPGARASGKRVGGLEWISVPRDADVEFSVSAADVEQFVADLEAKGFVRDDGSPEDDRMTVSTLRERLLVGYESSETLYDEDPTLTTRDGQTWVDGATVRVDWTEPNPGETTTPTPGEDEGVTVLAVDHASSLADESVTVGTDGESIDIGGWTVANGDGDAYPVPTGVTLDPGRDLVIHSDSGSTGDGDISLGADEPLWSPDGGTVEIRDAADAVRVSVRYDSRGVLFYGERPSEETGWIETAAEVLRENPVGAGGGGLLAFGLLYFASRVAGGNPDAPVDEDGG